MRKQRRLNGQEYVSSKGTLKKARTIKSSCKKSCRLKCTRRITKIVQNEIHDEYLNQYRSWDSKRQFISSYVTSKPVQWNRPRDSSRKNNRTQNNVYSFTIGNSKETVCKTYFLNTLAITEYFMRIALKKHLNWEW